MRLDKRIGDKFLCPGPGYGGSCFPKDPLDLVTTSKKFEVPITIVQSVITSNSERKKRMTQKIIEACNSSVEGKILTILGVTFKPETDDVRDSPSLDIIPALQKKGAIIHAFDPKGMSNAELVLPDVVWFEGPYEAMNGSDAVIILTEWNEFKTLDLRHTKNILKQPVIIDLRNIYTLEEMLDIGFKYVSVGRQTVFEKTQKICAVG
jgi:UDPglucose 6-dehydrogenase